MKTTKKTEAKIKIVNDAVTKKQVEFVAAESKLSRLRQGLGKLLTASEIPDRVKYNEDLARVKDQITDTEALIQTLPLQIAAIEENAKVLAENEKERRGFLAKQKAMVPKMLELSTLLVEQLEIAVETNTRLKELTKEYTVFQKETGENLLPDKFAGASSDYLDVAYSVLSRELRDGTRPGRLVLTQLRV